jgi:hypothetical protein
MIKALLLLGLIFGWQAKECVPGDAPEMCEIIVESPSDPTPPPYTLPYDSTPVPSQPGQDGGSTSDTGDGGYPSPVSNEQICADALVASGGLPGYPYIAPGETWDWGVAAIQTTPVLPYTIWATIPVTAGAASAACEGISISVFASSGTVLSNGSCSIAQSAYYRPPDMSEYERPWPNAIVYSAVGGVNLRKIPGCTADPRPPHREAGQK